MPVSVVVGGQYGSEGKGKVTHWLTSEMKASAVVRVGGPNSGHTVVTPDGEKHIFYMLPTAALCPNTLCILPAGSYLRKDLLLEEIGRAGLNREDLVIDPKAVIISTGDSHREHVNGLTDRIGSTGSGTGEAVVNRIQRLPGVCFAADAPGIKEYVFPAVPVMRDILEKNERIIIEGTQGFGLSILHTPHYPYATSRDTTASGFVSEAGLSPLDVDDVVMVLRALPIRVGGNSGPLLNETDWDTVTHEAESPTLITEYTTVTKRKRRVAWFDPGIVRLAIAHNRPTRIVMNHLDELDANCLTTREGTAKTRNIIACYENGINRKIDFVGYAPSSIVKNHA